MIFWSVGTRVILVIRFEEVWVVCFEGIVLIRLVNLGGWGILEPWITPSIFEQVDQSLGIIDEYTLTQNLERGQAIDILYSHWATFYTFAL
jgi:hypothetical protein